MNLKVIKFENCVSILGLYKINLIYEKKCEYKFDAKNV